MKAIRVFLIELLTFALVFVPRHWRELQASRGDYVSNAWIVERKRNRVI